MNILLVQAPCWVTRTPPYNLALLKAVCLRSGHQASCLDYNIKFYHYLREKGEHFLYDNPTNWFDESYVQEIIKQYPDFLNHCVDEIVSHCAKVIGFSVNGLNVFFAQEIALRVKQVDTAKVILFGGPHCFRNERGENLITLPFIDAVCYLEGESVLPQFLTMVENGQGGELFSGMDYKTKDGKVVSGRAEECNKDLDRLPFADFSDFNLLNYTAPELPLSTSRGCVNRCLFCSESRIWKQYRTRSAASIFEEMRYQGSRYPMISSFFFNDSLLNADVRVLNALCDLLIKNKLRFSWGGQAAIHEGMDKKLLLKMKKAGFCHVSYGLESASPRILKMIGKKFSPALAQRVIRETKKAGIRTDVNIIVGVPGESDEDIYATAQFLHQNKKFIDEVFFHPLVISKGSGFFQARERLGIQFENEHNPNTWYLAQEENSLEMRMQKIEYLKARLSEKGKSFFSDATYNLFIAEGYFSKGEYEKAYCYYTKAKQTNKDSVKDETIKARMELTVLKAADKGR